MGVQSILTRWAPLSALTALVVTAARPALAQDATWSLNPGTADFNNASNWTPATVPTGTAFFGISNLNSLSLSGTVVVGGWTFNPDASAYSFDVGAFLFLRFTTSGILVNGGSATINNSGAGLSFAGSSTASNAVINNVSPTSIIFSVTSTAGNATINNNIASLVNFVGASTAGNATINNIGNGSVGFFNTSTAGNATINNSGTGFVQLFGTSTAGNATINNSGFAFVDFRQASTAGNATINSSGSGTVRFFASSSGGTARLIANAGGQFDISRLDTAGTTAGSIEGVGTFTLGSKALTVGGNGLSTTVSGIIEDGSFFGTGGLLVKIGTGTLTLTGTNTYTGGTTVSAGTLVAGHIDNAGAFDTFGNGGITLNGGTLRSSLTGILTNDINVNAGTSTIASATGTTLTIGGGPTQYNAAANSVMRFGTSADIGTIEFGGVAIVNVRYELASRGRWRHLAGFSGSTLEADRRCVVRHGQCGHDARL